MKHYHSSNRHALKKFNYHPCERFMDSGGIYRRAKCYPVTAGMVQRVFRTAIHIRFDEPDFRRNSANSNAFNRQAMHTLFAYQIRPSGGRWPEPPPTREPLPIPVEEVASLLWREAA